MFFLSFFKFAQAGGEPGIFLGFFVYFLSLFSSTRLLPPYEKNSLLTLAFNFLSNRAVMVVQWSVSLPSTLRIQV